MHITALLTIYLGRIVVLVFVIRALVRTYVEYRGKRLVVCPETEKYATMKIDAPLAACHVTIRCTGTTYRELFSLARTSTLRARLQPVLNSEFSFKPVDFVAKPPLEDLFGLRGIQSGDSSALLIERNMVTRDIFVFARLGDVLHENAFSARMTP